MLKSEGVADLVRDRTVASNLEIVIGDDDDRTVDGAAMVGYERDAGETDGGRVDGFGLQDGRELRPVNEVELHISRFGPDGDRESGDQAPPLRRFNDAAKVFGGWVARDPEMGVAAPPPKDRIAVRYRDGRTEGDLQKGLAFERGDGDRVGASKAFAGNLGAMCVSGSIGRYFARARWRSGPRRDSVRSARDREEQCEGQTGGVRQGGSRRPTHDVNVAAARDLGESRIARLVEPRTLAQFSYR